jgi:hypothetical protein
MCVTDHALVMSMEQKRFWYLFHRYVQHILMGIFGKALHRAIQSCSAKHWVGWGDQLELNFCLFAYLLLLCIYDIVKWMSLYIIVIVDFYKMETFLFKMTYQLISVFAIQGRKKANNFLCSNLQLSLHSIFCSYGWGLVSALNVHHLFEVSSSLLNTKTHSNIELSPSQ